jgi:hypothetical protein
MMAKRNRPPLLTGQRFVPHFDADANAVVLTGSRSGPAGVTVLDVNGVSVSFDIADPGRLSQVVIEDVDRPDELLQRADQLAPLISSSHIADLVTALSATRRPLVLGVPERSNFDDTPPQIGLQWAYASAAIDAEERLGLLQQERLVQRLESGLLTAMAGLPQSVLGDAASLNDRLNELFQLSFGELDLLDLRSGGRVAKLLASRDLAAHLPDVAEAVRRVARLLGDPDERSELAVAEAAHTITEIPGEACDSANLLAGGPELRWERPAGDEWLARLEGFGERSDGWWVRVYHADGNTPIAIVPIRCTSSGDGEARLVLPPNIREDDIEWEILPSPDTARPSLNFRRVRRALSSAETATRLERLGSDAAAGFWTDAAQHHHAVGDVERTEGAMYFAGRAELRAQGRQPGARERGFPGSQPEFPELNFNALVSDLLGPALVTPPPTDLPPAPPARGLARK